MQISSLIVDDFLENFPRWREWLDTAVYGDVQNVVDGVTYEDICTDIPAPLRGEIVFKLQALCSMTKLNYLFARRSIAGAHAPHWAHHDASMGNTSMMLYMNRYVHCSGGTVLLKHMDGDIDQRTWARDTNDVTMWHTIAGCEMFPNRAFIFPAAQMHAAMPLGGFGDSPVNARLVITAMFDA